MIVTNHESPARPQEHTSKSEASSIEVLLTKLLVHGLMDWADRENLRRGKYCFVAQNSENQFMIDSSHSPIVNFDIALRRLANNPFLLHELIGFFREDVPELIEKIEAGLVADDAALVRRASHSIKSMAASFEGLRVVHVAFAIEQNAAAGDLDSIPSLLPQLRRAITELEFEFDRYGTPTQQK